jgi:hypothetical protein
MAVALAVNEIHGTNTGTGNYTGTGTSPMRKLTLAQL